MAILFATNLELWDTRLDNRPNDAARRATAFATGAYAKKLLEHQPLAPPGARWNELDAHDGYTIVSHQLGGLGAQPPDTTKHAWRAVTTKTTDVGPHAWRGDTTTSTTYVVSLVRTSKTNPWYVESYQLA